jgi:uncharacterized protein (TIGR03435 family)
MLAEGLSGVVGRTIVNETGLTGNYTFGLQWTPEAMESGDPEATPGTIFTALQEQLGLKLNSRRLPVEVVVIERLERPTEN